MYFFARITQPFGEQFLYLGMDILDALFDDETARPDVFIYRAQAGRELLLELGAEPVQRRSIDYYAAVEGVAR
jgi:hypothetical protein